MPRRILRRVQSALLATAIAVLSSSAGMLLFAPPSQAVQYVERSIATGVMDYSKAQGPRWRSIAFTTSPESSGNTVITLSWTGTADLQFRVLDASGNLLGRNLTSTNPKSATVALTPATTYYANVWALSGVGSFSLVMTEGLPDAPPPDPDPEPDPEPDPGSDPEPEPEPEPEPNAKPNVIVINTDDQRTDTLEYMPKLRSWMQDGGTFFPNGYVSTPSCCPSRASLMSGRYVHNNGQYQHLVLGFNLENTTQRYLKQAGYLTGHSGKFLHWLPLNQRAPYWDRWTYFRGGYYNVAMMLDNTYSKQSGNSTVITFDRAMNYVTDFEARDDSQPFYLHIAPIAPHGPSTAEPQYASAAVPAMTQTPNQGETDRTDKPPHVRNRSVSMSSSLQTRTAMIRTLYTVDDQFDRLMRQLESLGELDNTLIVYTSDNGFLWGEHQLQAKFRPYPVSVNVPFLVRWPGRVAAGATDPRQVTHVDVLPTVLAAAGITQSSSVLDGHDILSGHSRDTAYMEYYYDPGNNNGIPTWASIRTSTFQYTEYYGADNAMTTVSFREYYDMVNDPFQLVNLYGDGNPANDPDTAALSAQLAAQKTCVGATCS